MFYSTNDANNVLAVVWIVKHVATQEAAANLRKSLLVCMLTFLFPRKTMIVSKCLIQWRNMLLSQRKSLICVSVYQLNSEETRPTRISKYELIFRILVLLEIMYEFSHQHYENSCKRKFCSSAIPKKSWVVFVVSESIEISGVRQSPCDHNKNPDSSTVKPAVKQRFLTKNFLVF